MLALAIAVLVLLLALREVATNRIHRAQAGSAASRRWRAGRRWLNLALLLAALALLPTFLGPPELPILSEAHLLLSYAWPLLLGAMALAVALAVRIVTPEIQGEIEQRRLERWRRTRAAQGLNPEYTSRELREWIAAHGPAYRYDYDVPTPSGTANILIRTSQGRYAVYVLPPEHGEDGLYWALGNCSRVAAELDARGIVWVTDTSPSEPQRGRDYPVYVVYGTMVSVLELVERMDTILQRRTERREQRQGYAAADAERAHSQEASEEAQRAHRSRNSR